MATDLTSEARLGFDRDYMRGEPGNENARHPYIWSSDSWVAYEAGAYMATLNFNDPPVMVRKSRGYSVRILTASGASYVFTMRGEDLESRTLANA